MKQNRMFSKLFAVVGTSVMSLSGVLGVLLFDHQQAQAAPSPNPYTSSVLTKTYDGTGFVDNKPSPASSFINSENGFYPGDNSPTDGNVTSNDTVGYRWETKVAAGSARIVEVSLGLPEYLEFNKSDNGTFCVNAAGIKATYNNNAANPGCIYDVKAGQSFSAAVDIILTAKDTAGTIQENQVLTTKNSISGQAAYSTDNAQPVTVLSAPTADLLIRSAQCTLEGSCSSIPSTTTTFSFVIWPEAIKWQGYDSLKGASSLTSWTAQLDVSGIPAGTIYKVGTSGPVLIPNSAGILDLPSTSGAMTLNYTVPANWGGGDFEPGENRDFPVHLIVPDTAFSTEDYLNNGSGWEPGQGEGSAFSTLNDRNSGARKGYYYANNDWTMAKVYRSVPLQGSLFNKTIDRPWSSNQTLWEDGNLYFKDAANVVTVWSESRETYRKVTEGAETRSYLNIYPSNNPAVISEPSQVVMMDSWNTQEIVLSGNPVLVDGSKNPVTDYVHTIQWSPKVISNSAGMDPNNSTDWFNTKPAAGDMTKVKSVRIIIDEVTLGAGAPAQFSLEIPQKVVDPYPVENPGAYFDNMTATVVGRTGISLLNNHVVPVTKPTPSVGLSAKDISVSFDREKGSVDYVYTPTASGLVSTQNPITGTVTFTLDTCITDINLTGTGWELVGVPTYGTGCSTGASQNGSFTVKPVGDGWIPANKYDTSTGVATLPEIQFNAKVNPLVMGDITMTGVWKMTTPSGAQPSEPVTLITNAGDFELNTPALETSTPKVEINEPISFTASVTSKNIQEISQAGEAIIVLPGKGNDSAYLSVLENDVPGANTTYRDEGNPLESDFHGTYLVASVELESDISVPGSQLLCTRVVNPSMDPSDAMYAGSAWSTNCTDSASNPITAFKIVQPGGSKPAGTHIKYTLQPTGNQVDDLYLTWIGPLYGASGGAKAMVWPVNNVVVASTISGYTYWDNSGKGMARTDSSKPVEGMTVQLLNEAGTVIATTTVDENGYYEFTGLHSGNYTTRVPAIGQPGGAPATLESHFNPDREITVEQTFSYARQRGDLAKPESTVIRLGIDATVPNVNFGYYAPDPYSDLLKMPASVQCDGDSVTCDVAWEIVVKNGGEALGSSKIVALTGLGMPEDPFSPGWYFGIATTDGVYRVEAGVDGATKIEGISGTPIAITGDGTDYSYFGVATTDGAYQVKAGDSGNAAKIEGISGTPVAITGSGEDSSYFGVATTDGVYQVKAGDSGNATKIEGISGTPIAITGSASNISHFGVATTDGVYRTVTDSGNATKIEGISGTPIAITGDGTNYSYFGVATTDGVYRIVTDSGNATKIEGISGTPIAITGSGVNSAYFGVATTDGVYRTVTGSGNATKIEGISGTPIAITGDGSFDYFGIATTDGAYRAVSNSGNATKIEGISGTPIAITGRGTNAWYFGIATTNGMYQAISDSGNATPINKDDGGSWTERPPADSAAAPITLTGGKLTDSTSSAVYDIEVMTGEKVVDVVAGASHSLALTSSGEVYAWGAGSSGQLGNGATGNEDRPVQVLAPGGTTGVGPYLTGISQISAGYSHSLALTSTGDVYAWGASSSGQLGNGLLTQQTKPVQSDFSFLEKVFLSALSETQNGAFTTRDYKIQNLEPGEEITYYLSGKVNRKSYESPVVGQGFVIGNQAWESFNETPRTAPILPKPALPAYDATKPYQYGQWAGNDTCTATDSWVTPGDQCGQVFAQVEPTSQLLGSLEGYVFWDQNRSGTQIPSDPMVVGAHVALYKGVNGEFANKVGEAITDGSGFYKFDNLVSGSDYYVAFTPVQNPTVSDDGGSTTSSMLTPGQSWVYTTQYTDSPYYAANKSSANADGFTRNVAVVANQVTQPVNAGLAVYKAGIEVVKGQVVGGVVTDAATAELDTDNPGFTKPITVTSVSTNTGQEPLSNLVFVDTNIAGPKVSWTSCTIDDPSSTADLSGTQWDGDTFTYTFPAATALNVGGKLTCTGTLPAISTDEFPEDDLLHEDSVDVSGIGTITGTPVADDAPFEVTQTELPTPKITLEKGIATPIVEGTDCSDSDNAINENLCSIVSGTEAAPVEIGADTVKVTFRVKNIGDEPLLDPTLADETTIGPKDTDTGLFLYNVENIVCDWPTKTVNGNTRNYLGTNENQVAVCVGDLTIPEGDIVHQDQAEVFAVGEVSKKLVTEDAEFNAKTGQYDRPGINLPMTGGRATTLFGITILLATATGVLTYRARKQAHLRKVN